MYLYPMGDDDTPINPNSLYKSAEVIDVDSEEYEDEESKELFESNNQYKRITKQWLIAQEVARFSLFLSGTSWLFLLFRSVNWFPLVVSLFVLFLLGAGLTFSLAWSKLKSLDKIRLFVAGILTGFSAAISGSDIVYLSFMNNQMLALSIVVSVLVILTLIGIFSIRTKVLRY